jgi:hypothetical protein
MPFSAVRFDEVHNNDVGRGTWDVGGGMTMNWYGGTVVQSSQHSGRSMQDSMGSPDGKRGRTHY